MPVIGSDNVVWQPAIKIVFDLENCVAPEVVSSPEASPPSPSTSKVASTSATSEQGKDGDVKPTAEVDKAEVSCVLLIINEVWTRRADRGCLD